MKRPCERWITTDPTSKHCTEHFRPSSVTVGLTRTLAISKLRQRSSLVDETFLPLTQSSNVIFLLYIICKKESRLNEKKTKQILLVKLVVVVFVCCVYSAVHVEAPLFLHPGCVYSEYSALHLKVKYSEYSAHY